MTRFISADEVDRLAIAERKVAIIGYGSQGHAHALNLRDEGIDLRVGLRPGSASWHKAEREGLRVLGIEAASDEADIVVMLVPDTDHKEVFEQQVAPHLHDGDALGFAHGFAIRFGTVTPGDGIDVFLVAPAGPGHLMRRAYLDGAGLAALVAIDQDSTGRARDLAVAYADAIGSFRAVVIETTFAEETETDLFGEQAVLCGGLVELARAGFSTLVDAGYQPEIAYLECVHQLKLIVDLIYEQGIEGMHFSISDTAEFGALTAGPRVIADAVREAMRAVLDAVRAGAFADRWIADVQNGRAELESLRSEARREPIEKVGENLRSKMSFLRANDSRFDEVSGG
ncbi:MAG: ketol-acid reductoisomerase [Acidimicrobiales bacterium]